MDKAEGYMRIDRGLLAFLRQNAQPKEFLTDTIRRLVGLPARVRPRKGRLLGSKKCDGYKKRQGGELTLPPA